MADARVRCRRWFAGSGSAISVLRRVAALLLLLAGGLACAYGTLILVSTGSSDTATETLVGYGLIFVLPGIAAVTAGTRLLRRH
jgi:hypothetical protein